MKPGRHICTACNFIYEEPGSQENEKEKRLSFDELPSDWKCPACGADKDMYQPCTCVTLEPDVHEHRHDQASR